MSAANGWTEITELSPPPAGVPLQVRVVLRGVALALPMMFAMVHGAPRYRHINRAPDERGAWLDPAWRVTHWQHTADPYIPPPRYTVVRRTYHQRGQVSLRFYASGMTFTGAQAEREAWRESWAGIYVDGAAGPLYWGDLLIVTDDEAKRMRLESEEDRRVRDAEFRSRVHPSIRPLAHEQARARA